MLFLIDKFEEEVLDSLENIANNILQKNSKKNYLNVLNVSKRRQTLLKILNILV